MAAEEATFEGWAILELMGHRRLAGYVREVQIAGAGFLRLDVPANDPDNEDEWTIAATQFYPPSSVYCLTPTTECEAWALARNVQPQPVHRWELPAPPRPEPIDVDEADTTLELDEDEERIPF